MWMNPSFDPRRRQLFGLAVGLLCVDAHGSVRGSSLQSSPARTVGSAEPPLAHLELATAAPLDAMKAFYGALLGLPIVSQSKAELTIAAGSSRVTFITAAPSAQSPFYHFAFNIPENKILAAWQWQTTRTRLLPIPERLRAPGYPPEVVNYSHWNAHSIFFLDPGGNVVEYIARHDLGNSARGDFGPADILYASEIALVVDDVAGTAATVGSAVGVRPYRTGDANFVALGDERGLLLIIKRGRILNFDPTSTEKAAGVYRTSVRVKGTKPGQLEIEGFPYRLHLG